MGTDKHTRMVALRVRVYVCVGERKKMHNKKENYISNVNVIVPIVLLLSCVKCVFACVICACVRVCVCANVRAIRVMHMHVYLNTTGSAGK